MVDMTNIGSWDPRNSVFLVPGNSMSVMFVTIQLKGLFYLKIDSGQVGLMTILTS